MEATSFPESNFVFDKPIDMSYDQCDPLSVWVGQDATGQNLVISCFKFTKEELEEATKTGRIWVYHYGNQLQPHALATKNPFKE